MAIDAYVRIKAVFIKIKFIMKKPPKNNSQNVVVALIAVTGISVVGQSGLTTQLLQALDESVIRSASAQNIRGPEEGRTTPTRDLSIQELNANFILIENNRGYQLTNEGDRTPLRDGYYRFPSGEILTIQGSRIIHHQRSMVGERQNEWEQGNTWEQGPDAGPPPGWNEGEVWVRDTSGDQSLQRQLIQRGIPGVRDTFERIQPGTNRVPPNNINPDLRR
ncbi:hypothetical protein Cyast_0761 [Cyanobacterium stanieri PCC 7202]|uniref:Uncharacterized protein n=1 Tax=Cyanobacterium stanieri (strain ATCC 29140 / PCC 7202) TaxID=292563 RepID=K9YKX6_CYASC|nr:hypothetical protein Cyast_0761 [Cyanobacterium stanieri PCC 7202]